MIKMTMTLTTTIFIVLALVQINDAAKSFQEKLCEDKFPELARCNIACPDGKAWVNGCPICACRSSLCYQKTCRFGESCTIQQQIGQYEDQYTDVAVCQLDARAEPITTQAPTVAPTTPFLGSCAYAGRCDADGKCATKDAICRIDGWCCKVKKIGVYNLGGVSNNMASCLEAPDVGQCRAMGVQYFYNNETGKCESMLYGGCVSSRNSFATIELCQQTCEHPCQKPKTEFVCRASIPRYYFNEETEACEPFDLGGCAGTANYFMTPWDCEAHCKGLGNKAIKTNGDNQEEREATNPTTVTRQTSEVPGYHDERESLRRQIVDSFRRRQLQVDDKGIPSPTIGGGGPRVWYRPRPGQRIFKVDENGNLVLATNPTPTPETFQPTTTGQYTHLDDRFRSIQQELTNRERGQSNYSNTRLRYASRGLPVYSDRRPQPYARGAEYQKSANALRAYLDG